MKLNIRDKKFASQNIDELQRYLSYRFDEAETKRSEKTRRFTEGYALYEGLLPKALPGEPVPYVVPVVRNVVDKLQPSLMNIFTENEAQAVTFRPQRTMLPKEVIDAVNLKVNDIFLRQNNGYNVLSNAFREALLTGDTFLKVFIDEEVIEEDIDFGEDGIPMEAILMVIQEFPDTDLTKADVSTRKVTDELTQEDIEVPFISGKVTLTRIERKPRISFVPFDEMFVLADTVDICDTQYLCHRIKKTVGDLLDMGFDKEVVLRAEMALDTDSLSTEDLANMKTFSSSDLSNDEGYIDPMGKSVFLFEHYIYTSLLNKKGKMKLYQVLAVNTNDILEVNEVERIPFVHGVPDAVPGSFWGTSIAERFKDDQILMSSLLRDFATLSKRKAVPTFVAVKDQYNRASLLDINKPGSVLEVHAPGAVSLMDTSGDTSGIVNVLQYIQGTAQESIMNSIGAQVDPSSMANMSATAVAISTHNSEMKDKRIAKSLAYTMVRPLFEMLYNIIRDQGLPLEVEGMVPTETGEMVPQVVPFDSTMLPARSEFYIDVNTANDDAVQVGALNSVAATLVQLGQIPSQVITPQNMYNLGARMLKAADITNVDDYVTDPSKNQPSPQELELQAQQQAMLQQMEMDKNAAQMGLAAAQQNQIETQTEELIRMNNWKREMDERNLLVSMEKLELERQRNEAEAAERAIRNELRATELAIEAETGVTIGVS